MSPSAICSCKDYASETASSVQLRDARGLPVTVTPGDLDDEADHLYMNGQCLALAIALAQESSWGVAVHTYGEEGLVAHAWAVDGEGQLRDIRGEHDRESVEMGLAEDELIEDYKPSEVELALEDFDELIGRQDIELARTFVPALVG